MCVTAQYEDVRQRVAVDPPRGELPCLVHVASNQNGCGSLYHKWEHQAGGLGSKDASRVEATRSESRDEERLSYNAIFEVKQIRVGHRAKGSRVYSVERGTMTERSRLPQGP